MRIGPLELVLHRTVRVADGRQPANLPPSLGRMKVYDVSKFKERCPSTWEETGVFVGLHPNEAMWLSFNTGAPVALLIGAGSINALTGKKLGTKLEKDNYLVTPPQPWLDGWKATDGTVFQFVATEYKKGEGNTVAEQLIGAESKTGGIGIALFESKEPIKDSYGKPVEHYGSSAYYGDDDGGLIGSSGGLIASLGPASKGSSMKITASSSVLRSARPSSAGMVENVKSARSGFSEMGLGKGGKIIQKVYADPYGLDVWKELPSQTRAIYVVGAALLSEITGDAIPPPVSQANYGGGWFGVQDGDKADVEGTEAFTGLKSVFAEETDPVEKK